MKHTLTPWYPGHIKPARRGVYQVRGADGTTIGYQKWNGKLWLAWDIKPSAAAKFTHAAHYSFQNDDWRGIAK